MKRSGFHHAPNDDAQAERHCQQDDRGDAQPRQLGRRQKKARRLKWGRQRRWRRRRVWLRNIRQWSSRRHRARRCSRWNRFIFARPERRLGLQQCLEIAAFEQLRPSRRFKSLVLVCSLRFRLRLRRWHDQFLAAMRAVDNRARLPVGDAQQLIAINAAEPNRHNARFPQRTGVWFVMLGSAPLALIVGHCPFFRNGSLDESRQSGTMESEYNAKINCLRG